MENERLLTENPDLQDPAGYLGLPSSLASLNGEVVGRLRRLLRC